MGKTNGKSEVEPLDVSHELPPAEADEMPAAEAGAPPEAPLSGDVATLREQVRQLSAERDTLLERLARAQAEFENARKRAQREQAEHREYALAEALKTLLPAVDSLDHALAAASGGGELRKGLELIHRQFHDALAKLGLRPIAARGEKFDPKHHQAVEMVESSAVPDHHVAEELQRGYMFKGRLLRPAMVRVARKK